MPCDSHALFRIEPLIFVVVFRYHLGLSPWAAGKYPEPALARLLPLGCKHHVAASAPHWAHVISCNLGALAAAKHDALRAAWNEIVRIGGGTVGCSGEFAPFGPGDDRRVGGVIGGVPVLMSETCVDYAITCE